MSYDLITQLNEAANRNEEIQAITLQAFELAVKKYTEYFEDGVAEKARKEFTAVKRELTKRDMTNILQDAGVIPASEVAQYIITQSFKLDSEATKAKMAAQ
jgi:hypothetical protein